MSNNDNNRAIASISLDLDNQWSYMKTHGDSGWESFPSYLETVIPIILDALDKRQLKITFFIVGQDASLDKNADVLRLITQKGHEVGNHSFNHEPWLHLYSKDQLKQEILEAEKNILRVTGEKPVGFRGPGFTWSHDLIEVLADAGYKYDASTFPTYLGPLAGLYYFWQSNLTQKEKKERKVLFGSFKEGRRPNKPYYWQTMSGAQLLEIPVTTIPIIKTPFHLSYLIYLSRFSETLMHSYLQMAVSLCRLTRTSPSFLLHPLDFLGSDLAPALSFFPGMNLGSERKIMLFHKVTNALSMHFELVGMGSFAAHIQAPNEESGLSVRQLKP